MLVRHQVLRRSTVTALALLSLVASLAVSPASAAGNHPDPGVIRLDPIPGDVIAAGRVTITAILFTRTGVDEAQVVVDGAGRAFDLRARDGHNQTITSVLDLAPGLHVADISFRDAEGRVARRQWRFSTTDLPIDRHAGDDRVATAVAISRDSYPEDGSAGAAVLATAEQFPDALAGSPLAVAVDGPMLLTDPDALSEAASAELERLLLPLSTVYLLGGTAALSETVAQDVRDLGFQVQRLEGPNRFATAAAVADELDAPTTAILANGGGYADALAAAAPASREGWPILLTDRDELPAPTRSWLEGSSVTKVIIVGGPQAVSSEVEAAVDATVDEVARLQGNDRYETAERVVRAFYDADAPGVAVVSGQGFADALAGGPHAARLDIPVLLSRRDGLPPVSAAVISSWQPPVAHLYGGPAALTPTVDADVRRAVVNADHGPFPTTVTPAPGEMVPDIDTVEVAFDRGLDLDRSSLYVTVDGLELYGVMDQGDFKDRLVFRADELPIHPVRGQLYDVEVHVLATDGNQWHHLRWSFAYHKTSLGRGDTGPEVVALQQRLRDLGYWLPAANGNYDYLTSHAVMAFQKAERLPRTGTADHVTQQRLSGAQRPTPRAARSGRWVEVDKTRQIAMFINNGVVEWTMNTSTGTERSYTRPDGSTGVAHTPEGWFTFFRQIDGMRESDLGQMWRPKYFTDAGHAIHGSTSVPAYPASHGCVRLSYPGIDFVGSAGLAPLRTPVYVYR